MPRSIRLALVALAFVLGGGIAVVSLPTREPDSPPPTEPAEPAAIETTSPVAAETVIRRGDTLATVLARNQLSREDAAGIVSALREAVDLRRVRPGERLVVLRNADGSVAGVNYWPTRAEGHEVRADGDEWTVHKVEAPVETRPTAITGRLDGSLFVSLDRLGELPNLTARLVHLFEWDFDFTADCLPGDQFRLLVEKRYAHGEFIGYGDILIAQYQPAGRPRLTAIAFADAQGHTAYYDAAGRSVRKMFLRAPLDFTRITSGYSHARRHPVLGGVRPHLAVDYGAPVGTPVRAVADGVVTSAGWRDGNGLSVTLRHPRGYQTMYNHLSRALVRRGQRVSQRQVIGRVGSTGLSTGPHLDYRVIKHGRFVNPLSEEFVPGAPVPPERRPVFETTRAALLERLDRAAPFKPDDPES